MLLHVVFAAIHKTQKIVQTSIRNYERYTTDLHWTTITGLLDWKAVLDETHAQKHGADVTNIIGSNTQSFLKSGEALVRVFGMQNLVVWIDASTDAIIRDQTHELFL